jgi:hypothetical protein
MNLYQRYLKSLHIIAATLTLTACGSTLAPDFGEMSEKYANILEQYQINMLFVNILRASENRPVSFLDMPSINGSGSITTTPTASALFTGGIFSGSSNYLPITGGGLTTFTPGVSLSVGNNFNFSQSSLDNAVFWKGFLSELPIESVVYFEHSHIPKEVLLSLVMDEIQITQPDGKMIRFINDPLRPDHAEFQRHLYRLIELGIGVYKVNTSSKLGGPLDPQQLKAKFGGENSLQFLKTAGIVLEQVGDRSKLLFQPVHVSEQYKICIQKNEFENYVTAEYGNNVFCKTTLGESVLTPAADKKNQPQLTLRIRSTNNIFEYLGKVVKAQLRSNDPYMVTLPVTAGTYNPKNGQSNQYALLVVNKDKTSTKPFASATSLFGGKYFIPGENIGYSADTIKLLGQFMTLQKIPGSIPSSPAVLLK